MKAGPLFSKRTDVLPQDLVKSQSREIRVRDYYTETPFRRNDLLRTMFAELLAPACCKVINKFK